MLKITYPIREDLSHERGTNKALIPSSGELGRGEAFLNRKRSSWGLESPSSCQEEAWG